jgi:predicted transcriptional regulator
MKTDTDKLAEKILKESSRPISTYELAKRAKISWSTANMHLFKLMAFGVITGVEEETNVGPGRKMMWRIKR